MDKSKRKKARRLSIAVIIFGLIPSTLLQAQSSRVEIELFGLNAFSLKNISDYTYRFNAYGDSWDSYQETVFAKKSSRIGFGAGLTYWISDHVGLRLQGQTWSRSWTSSDNNVLIEYSYFPWYPNPSPDPVVVSYGLKSTIPPSLSYRIGALSLAGVLRTALGRLRLDFSGGLTVFQIGGDLQDIYFKRIIPSSHMTFLSEEFVYSSRFDFMSLGGIVGLDLSVPLGRNVEGAIGLKYLFGRSREPELFVASAADLDTYSMSVVLKGVDEIKGRIRSGDLEIDPSQVSLNLGVRFQIPSPVGPRSGGGRIILLFLPGVSGMNPDIGFTRTVLTAEDDSRRLEQSVALFYSKLLWSGGGGAGFRFSPRWAAELSYRRWDRELGVDSGVVVLVQDGKWRSGLKGQRPMVRAWLDEFGLSVVRFAPIPGGEVFVTVGANLSRLSLTMDEQYFLYWHKPWTSDFVSFSGLYSTAGYRWLLGASVGLGFQFPVAGPVEGRLATGYFFYPTAVVPAGVEEIVFDQAVSGIGDKTDLLPEELQARLDPKSFDFNPSRFQMSFGLAIRF
ncbi:MAG: hypothetical protein KJ908_07100 [Acidobacteria bacterium]|nr:hypothetical protein [Acidobacteriota bacterium]